MEWRAEGDASLRSYGFLYDGCDRLTSASYAEENNSATRGRYDESASYDLNGNILSLQRYGQTGSNSYGLIDNLSYSYSGNLLTAVTDAAGSTPYGGGTFFPWPAGSYVYDANGNLTQDSGRNICNIAYNRLNLPSQIVFGDGTVHRIGDETTTTDYCGNVIYENGVAKLLLTEEGYVTLSDSKYHYYLKDHQGNIRVVANQDGTVEEVNHYYPFGGLFATASGVQPYKYNGKELDRTNGLNWYDYGARMYDPALCRFLTMDPLAEKYYGISPYAYCGNNPVKRIDPDGKDWYDAVMGYVIGHVTNSIPGTGALRDAYTPTDASDYNAALRGIDNVTIAVGAVMADWGGKGTATGLALAAASGSVLLSTGGASIEVAGPAAVAGLQVAGGSAVVGAAGLYMAANAASNQSDGYDRGGKQQGGSVGKTSSKSRNQLNKDVERGKAPKGIDRFDNSHTKGGQEHVHFKDGSALNKDGSWKEGTYDLTRKQIEYLKNNGWTIKK